MGKEDQKFANELLEMRCQPARVAHNMSEKTKQTVLASDLNNIKQRMRYLTFDIYK
jgi:hypothetical protein